MSLIWKTQTINKEQNKDNRRLEVLFQMGHKTRDGERAVESEEREKNEGKIWRQKNENGAFTNEEDSKTGRSRDGWKDWWWKRARMCSVHVPTFPVNGITRYCKRAE